MFSVCVYRGHRNTSFYVKAVISPDDQYLLSGSSDEHAYLWQVSWNTLHYSISLIGM